MGERLPANKQEQKNARSKQAEGPVPPISTRLTHQGELRIEDSRIMWIGCTEYLIDGAIRP